MCLIIKKDEVPLVASKDITVYKALFDNGDKSAKSALQGFIYKLGQLYETEIEECDEMVAADVDSSIYYDVNYPKWLMGEGVKSIGPGFHSVATKSRIANDDGYFDAGEDLYECTVPEGSIYYQDGSGLLVSNKIIINKKIKRK